jgi:NAD(P)-dependent dehydrogenase (short-subunit alcohol dehydrogenase family)
MRCEPQKCYIARTRETCSSQSSNLVQVKESHLADEGKKMRGDLENKVVLVTGAGSGIGEACAKRIADGGGVVAVVDIDQEAADRVAAESSGAGAQAHGFQADVSDEGSVAQMMESVVERFGRLDDAVNNAGVGGGFFAVGDYPLDDWRQVMSVNLDGVFL